MRLPPRFNSFRFAPFALLALGLSACETPTNVVVHVSPQDAAFALAGKAVSDRAEAFRILESVPPLDDPALAAETEAFYRKLVAAKKHGAWDLEDRHTRTEILCHELCQCVSDSIVESIIEDARSPLRKFEVLQLYLTSNGGFVDVRVGRQGSETSRGYFYHQSTAFRDADGRVAIFDPIVFTDAKLHSLGELVARLESRDTLRIAVNKRDLSPKR